MSWFESRYRNIAFCPFYTLRRTIVFACLVLAALAFQVDIEAVQDGTMAIVAVLTLASIGFYVREWVVLMNAAELER